MLGQVMFNIEGIRQRLAARPMSKSYAEGNLIILSHSDDLTPDIAIQASEVAAEVAGDGDPVSDGTANDVQSVVLAALGVSNQVAQALAQDVAEKKTTYEFFRDLPKGIGEWLGQAAAAPATIAANGLLAFLRALFIDNPTGLVILAAGGGYVLYRRSRRRSA